MKKLLSMVLALTTVFSSFAAIVRADEIPTVTVETTKLTDDEYDDAVANLIEDALIEDESDLDGFAIYRIDAYVEGLALSRTNETKIAGTMLTGFEFAVNGDMSKYLGYYIDSTAYPYMGLAEGSTGFSLSWAADKFKGTKTFPLKGQTVDPEEPTLFYSAVVVVEDGTSFTVATASFATSVYTAGSPGAQTSYSTINYPATLTFGAPDPDPDPADPGIAPDNEKVETLSTAEKNYAIAKFSQKINGAKDYYVFAKDAEGNTNIKITENTIAEDDKAAAAKFKVDFGGIKNIDTSGDVSFFALVHSKTHVITAIRLIEVDR